jgi:hypothetical protein
MGTPVNQKTTDGKSILNLHTLAKETNTKFLIVGVGQRVAGATTG